MSDHSTFNRATFILPDVPFVGELKLKTKIVAVWVVKADV